VIHPFHPLRGQALLVLQQGLGHNRDMLILQADDGRVMRIPASWTDLRAPDEYVELSADRPRFRVPDLTELVKLISALVAEVRQ
jgi:hypothetical protein